MLDPGMIYISVVLLIGLFVLFRGRIVWGYRLGNEGIEILLFHRIILFEIRYEDIAEIRHSHPFVFQAWKFMDIRYLDNAVTIRKKNFSFMMSILITPEHPAIFVSEVHQRIAMIT